MPSVDVRKLVIHAVRCWPGGEPAYGPATKNTPPQDRRNWTNLVTWLPNDARLKARASACAAAFVMPAAAAVWRRSRMLRPAPPWEHRSVTEFENAAPGACGETTPHWTTNSSPSRPGSAGTGTES